MLSSLSFFLSFFFSFIAWMKISAVARRSCASVSQDGTTRMSPNNGRTVPDVVSAFLYCRHKDGEFLFVVVFVSVLFFYFSTNLVRKRTHSPLSKSHRIFLKGLQAMFDFIFSSPSSVPSVPEGNVSSRLALYMDRMRSNLWVSQTEQIGQLEPVEWYRYRLWLKLLLELELCWFPTIEFQLISCSFVIV